VIFASFLLSGVCGASGRNIFVHEFLWVADVLLLWILYFLQVCGWCFDGWQGIQCMFIGLDWIYVCKDV